MKNKTLITIQAKKIIKQKQLINRQKKFIDLVDEANRTRASNIDKGIEYMQTFLVNQTSFTKVEMNAIVGTITKKLTGEIN